jgi:radical SAM superfamily enzyme YgiQ (UPF0313 family)
VRVLLVSTYELGHQPLHVASPAAALRDAGHEVRCLDLAVEMWDPAAVDWAGRIAFSVPMHTAMRLAMKAAASVREQRPELPICFYGLYAGVSRDRTVGSLVDRVIAGEYEPALVAWASGREDGTPELLLGRGSFSVPARDLLPGLDRYARLLVGGEERLVGYVEASHGCVHKCRHCPLPVVYDGRIRIVGADTVLADIEQLVAAGAQHITFGDPDFLNGVKHSLGVVREMHERFPALTFDITTKVEHVLEHSQVWSELASCGLLFAICAVECLNDEILERLDKGHTAAQVGEAVALLREHGIEMRPSLLPFTPWTTRADLVDIFDWVASQDLIGNVDPVHYSIRLLVPEGSLVLDIPDAGLGDYESDSLSYRWSSIDPDADALQRELAVLAEAGAAAGESSAVTFAKMRSVVTGVDHAVDCCAAERPHMSEPWFCCAEPMENQFGAIA